jgi:plasmid replication initiation protein
MEKAEHEITVKQLCAIIGYFGNNHAAIKESLLGLVSTVMEWNIISEETEEEDWTASTILASVQIKGPLCRYAYSPRMKALLYRPAMYGKISLLIQSRFKSNYGLALYENCIRYQGLAHTKNFNYQVFRNLMGVPPDKYTIFRDFKRRVLDKSVEEVNNHSDMLVKPEIYRKGREVISIRFELKGKDKRVVQELGLSRIKNENYEYTEGQKKLLQRLIAEFGFNKLLAERTLNDYEEVVIQQKLDLLVRSNSYQKGVIQNLTAYVLDALKKDYTPPISSKHLIAEMSRVGESKKKQISELEHAYTKYQSKELITKIQALSQPELHEILKDFSLYLQRYNSVYQFLYEKEGLTNPIIGDYLLVYAKNKRLDILKTVMSLEEFSEKNSKKYSIFLKNIRNEF